jgi:hypothetical protein
VLLLLPVPSCLLLQAEADVTRAAQEAGVLPKQAPQAAAAAAGATPAQAQQQPAFVLPAGVPVALSLSETEAVVRDFNANYRGALKALADNTARFFPDRNTALGILRRLMSAVLTWYERFGALAAAAFPDGGPLRDIVPTATLYHEIKRYSTGGGR